MTIPYLAPLSWSVRTGRFRDAAGRFVSFAEVERAMTAAVEAAALDAAASTAALRSGAISLAEWQTTMQAAVKATHLVNAGIAHGGLQRLDADALARVQATIREEFGFLDRLAREIASGKQALDGRLAARSRMYLTAGRMTFATERGEAARALGFDQERNRLSAADHCAGCVAETARGWVPIGALRRIGTRTCLRNCRCYVEYRNSLTGEILR